MAKLIVNQITSVMLSLAATLIISTIAVGDTGAQKMFTLINKSAFESAGIFLFSATGIFLSSSIMIKAMGIEKFKIYYPLLILSLALTSWGYRDGTFGIIEFSILSLIHLFVYITITCKSILSIEGVK